MRPSPSRQWFEGDFNNVQYINSWAKTNINLMSKKKYPTTQQQQQQHPLPIVPPSLSPPLAVEQQPLQQKNKPGRKKKTLKPESFIDDDDSKQQQSKRFKITKATKQHEKRGKKSDIDSDTEDDIRPPLRHVKQPKPKPTTTTIIVNIALVNECTWWTTDSICQLKVPFIQTFPKEDLDTCDVRFKKQKILFFSTMYHLRKMPDGSAIGNSSMCIQVFFLYFILCFLFF